MRILKGGQETFLATGGGFAEVMPDRVSILTDAAVRDTEIDENVAQTAIDRAKAALEDKSIGTGSTGGGRRRRLPTRWHSCI